MDLLKQFEKDTDPNRDATKFNPKGIIGYGILTINGGRGLPDTPQNREIIKNAQITVKPRRTRFGGRKRFGVR